MEKPPFLMWTKRNHTLSPHLKLSNRNPTYDDSWEEQAFAEDALGPLGGCVWPPRSYFCSFCRREFRSAQALGGHMNVHRRDRARLKQSPVPSNNETFDPEHQQDQANHHQFQNPAFVSLDLPYNPNPNCDLLPPPPFVSPTNYSPNSRVSAPPSEGSCNDLTLNPSFKPTIPSPQSWPNSASDRIWNIMNRPMKVVEEAQEDHHLIKGEVPLSLSMVISARPDPFLDKEEVQSCKRRRIFDDTSLLLPLFIKPNLPGDKIQQEKKVDGFRCSNTGEDDLDLELRLGDRPNKVKEQS